MTTKTKTPDKAIKEKKEDFSEVKEEKQKVPAIKTKHIKSKEALPQDISVSVSDVLPEKDDTKERKPINKGMLALSISSGITVLVILALLVNLLWPDVYRRIFYSTPLDRGSVVMTIGDYKVMAEEYTSDLLSAAAAYENIYGKAYWKNNPKQELEILRDLENYYIERYCKLIWADELGIELTDAEKTQVDANIDAMMAAIGGRDIFILSLNENYMTEDLYYRLAYIDARMKKIEQALIDGAIGDISIDDIKASIDTRGVMRAKHILFVTTGDEAGDAAQMQLAENVLARIRAGEDFDVLMLEYSEDPGSAEYPDGYTFGPGEMMADFENAVKELEIGETSEIIETVYGYHIIQRLEVNYEDFYNIVFTERYNQKLTELVNSIDIKYGRGYKYISIADVTWR